MDLFRRMKSPKDRHVTHQTLETSSSSPSIIVSESFTRRHKSEEDIVLAVDSSAANLDESPPELPPRNRSDSSGSAFFNASSGYRRTQSSGTMSTTGFKSQAAGMRPQDDYFVPADMLKNMTISGPSQASGSAISPSRYLAQDKRHMSMHEKILSHNDPDFKATQMTIEKSAVVDTGDYSVPFDVLGESDGRKGVPPPKPPHSKRLGSRKPPSNEKLSEPPDYLPPPPPEEEEEAQQVTPVSPQSSPNISQPRPGDYDDPWDSTKFIKLRQRADTEPQKLSTPRFDPYKSPKGSSNELTEAAEPPLPPKLPDNTSVLGTTTTATAVLTNDIHLQPSPTPPPVPDTRPRASTGESDYIEPPDSVLPHNDEMSAPLHERVLNGEGYMHDYVNQPACPPKVPPRASNKKQHGYPQLVPPDISHIHVSDIQPTLPPAFHIDISSPLEEQL